MQGLNEVESVNGSVLWLGTVSAHLCCILLSVCRGNRAAVVYRGRLTSSQAKSRYSTGFREDMMGRRSARLCYIHTRSTRRSSSFAGDLSWFVGIRRHLSTNGDESRANDHSPLSKMLSDAAGCIQGCRT